MQNDLIRQNDLFLKNITVKKSEKLDLVHKKS